MSTDSAATNTSPNPAPLARPQTVDWALWALVVTAVLSIANGFARNFSESWVISNYRKTADYKNKTDAQLHKIFEDSKISTIISIILIAAILLVIGKYVRDGKNWARWLLAALLVIPILPTAYVFFITYAFTDGPFAIKFFGGLTGLAAVTAVSMMFVRPSMPYFRPSKASAPRRPSLLDGFLKPRGSFTNPAARPAAPLAGQADSRSPRAAGPDLVKRAPTEPVSPAPERKPQRAKSRKAAE
ncbi:MAG: hypothetical protein JWO63_1535 [Frankiales bacterium]|jgi:uncharacterized membrane protein required for colicin V production|nr:hypothetical protein [Frankiales bacterium]